jgi:N,N'-diacetyllegionaminate synthase
MQTRFCLNSKIKIESRFVGMGQPTFIIAEIGVNHNGDLKLAKAMIDAAKDAGADSAKFQTFRADEFMADKELVYEYEVQGKVVKEKMYDMFKRLEMPMSWHKELFAYARKLGLVPLTSVADPLSADMVKNVGTGAFKLSSEDLINLPLIEYVVKMKLPLIFSTGMADESEVKDVLKILKSHHHRNAIFLHCVSVYPTPDDEANLNRMLALKKLTKGAVGYSDHTRGIAASVAAVSLGATVIEKHFTLSQDLNGPDHYFSSDPREFKTMTDEIRRVEKMLGLEKLSPSTTEQKTRMNFRRSLVATKALTKGHKLTRTDLHLKRPGHGLKARDMKKLLGKKLKRDIKRDDIITLKDIT